MTEVEMKKLKPGTKLYRYEYITVHVATDDLYAKLEEVTFVSLAEKVVTLTKGKQRVRLDVAFLPTWSLTKLDALRAAEKNVTKIIEDMPRRLERLEEDREIIRAAIAKESS